MKVKKERSCSVCTIMEQFTRVYFRKEKNKYIVCYHLFKEQNVFWVVYTKKHVLKYTKIHPSSVQLLSRVWLCDPINRSTQGLPVHQQLREFTQIHVHWVGDVIQSSHPLLLRMNCWYCQSSIPGSTDRQVPFLVTYLKKCIKNSLSLSGITNVFSSAASFPYAQKHTDTLDIFLKGQPNHLDPSISSRFHPFPIFPL